jgi:hypothetical protein
MSAYIKRTESSQINNVMLHFKLLEKQEQAKLQTSRTEIVKIRTEINEIETKKKKKKNPHKVLTKQKAGSLKKITRLTSPWQI